MPDDRLLTRSLALCATANFLQALCFNLYLHLPGFLRGLGADEVMIGLLSGLTAVAAIAARPPVGRVMDSRGRRGVILAGGVLNTAVCSLYLGVGAIGPWLVGVRILHGLAEAMLFSALFTLAADLVPASRRTEGLALFGVSGILPISLGGLLGDWILARASYAALFATSSAFAALSLLFSLPLRDRPRPPHHETAPSRGFGAAAAQHDLLPLWFIGSVFATALSAVFTFVTTFVLTTGIGSVGLFFSFYSGAAVFLRLFLGWLPERVGPKAVLFPALALLCAGLLALAAATRTRDVALAGVLCGLGHGFTFPILSGLVVKRARDAERGAALSLFTALFDLGVLIGGPAFGAVIRAGGYPTAYAAAAGVVFLGAASFAAWDARVARLARPRVESDAP
ncbi:MAG TPA: MFS transporter [Myxococcota bacterium]|nr:MFS transporter [Myxococcota bacterium]